MSDTEWDYMSDVFIETQLKHDVRPGLIKGHEFQRVHNIFKKKKENDARVKLESKPKRMIESEKREEGLSAAIPSSNKGFSMLLKMGFAPGKGLGKAETGITEPVPVLLKTDRQGLGRLEALKQVKEQKAKIKARHQQNSISIDDYRSHLSKRRRERDISSDLRKSQKSCQNLDLQSGVTRPEEDWFWPICIPTEDEVLEEEAETNNAKDEDQHDISEEETLDSYEFDDSEKLEMLTTYLRQTYFYCVWCGVQYEDEKDLESCPGFTREDH